VRRNRILEIAAHLLLKGQNMNQDKAGPVVIGQRITIKRAHQFNCSNCARWDQLKEDQGICRLLAPANTVVGIGEAIDRTPRPVTHPIYNITQANDVCAFHPELVRAEMIDLFRHVFRAWDNRLAWDREKGFNRAPTAADAARFAVDGGEASPKS